MLTEASVLGATAALLGLLLSWWSLDALVSVLPLELPPHAAPALNARVLGLSMTAAMATIVVVTLWPAWRLAAASLTEIMSGAARHTSSGWPRAFGRGLIAAEVALAVVLLTGGGLLIRSLDRLLSVDLGFQPDAFVTMEAVPLDQSPMVWQQYYPQLLERLRAVPGVASAGAIDGMPLGGGMFVVMAVDETPGAVKDPLEGVVASGVSPGYLEALGVRLLEGRLFTEADRGRTVVVLDETAARLVSKDGTAVGLTVDALNPSTVIGVVSAIRQSPRHGGGARVYSALVPHAMLPPTVVIRAEPGVALSYADLRQAALSVGTRAVVERIRPGTELLDDTVATPRNRALLLGLLAGLGLLLTLIGTAGVTAYAVARRTQEVGVRMAFGATPRDVVAGITLEALRPIGTGVAVGLVASYFATSVLQSFLFQTPAHDPPTFAAVGALLATTSLIAAWLPARRAASVDPVQALRAE
jgi:putative ABC transport system permease protein